MDERERLIFERKIQTQAMDNKRKLIEDYEKQEKVKIKREFLENKKVNKALYKMDKINLKIADVVDQKEYNLLKVNGNGHNKID